VLAFLVICAGITLLQLSKVDPKKLKVDEKTNLLLAANRQEINNPEDQDPEKAIEAPGELIIECISQFSSLGADPFVQVSTVFEALVLPLGKSPVPVV
jgi:hypothetical protein